MDVSTGKKRQLTSIAGRYSGAIYGKYLLVTDDNYSPYSDYYIADLEKLGILDANGELIVIK